MASFAEVTSVVDGSGRSVSTFECSVRDPPHGASFYIRFGLGGPVEFNGRSVKYAERVLNLVVEPTVDSEPNRWVELAGRQQKASDVARCAESHPSIRIDPRQGSGNSPLHGGRLLVPRRRASPRRRSSPPRVQAVTRRPRRTAGRCLQRLLGCAGGLHARVVPPYDGPTQALRPHRGGSERPVR